MQKSIVNQAVADSFFHAFEVLLAQFTGNLKVNAKIIQARGVRGFVRGNAYDGSFRCQSVLSQVLRGVKACARTKGGEEQLGRGHSFVEAAVFRRLVARDSMLTRSYFKLDSAEMFHLDFHGVTSEQDLPGLHHDLPNSRF